MSDTKYTELKTLLETGFAQMLAEIKGVDARLRAVENGLSRLEGNVDGRLTEMSHRITDVYTRLPVPIAYQPPEPSKKRA
jgi:hypothetical protein